MSKPIPFILNDEILNNYGFWISTEGIDTSQFEKNPIMYFQHIRPGDYENNGGDMILPIGRWENIRKEANKLLADAVFDENDEFAMKIKSKVDGGFLRMASAGIEPVELSDATENLKPGQYRMTVTRSKIKEGSIVDRGANDNALRLYGKEGKLITLKEGENAEIPIIKLNVNMKKETLNLLQLKDGASPEEIEQAVVAMAAESKAQKAKLEAYELADRQRRDAEFDLKLNDPKKKFTEDQKTHFRALRDMNHDTAMNAMKIYPDYKPAHEFADGDKNTAVPKGREEWTFSDWQEKDGKGLEKLKDTNFDLYADLYRTRFGKEPVK